MARRSREKHKNVQDIGEIPAVANPERRARAATDFRFFCETYFPHQFFLGWSPDHLKIIARIEAQVLYGGLCCYAMPRKSGKTTLSEAAVLWAVLYGRHEFALLIGATGAAATEMFESIKTELESNETLAADFPEVSVPIKSLNGINQRKMLYHGKRIKAAMKSNQIVLPNIPGAASASATIRVASMTGRMRGMKYKRPDGRSVRPSLCVIDDPQDEKSAHNPAQCKKREMIIKGVILGLAGPNKRISVLMPCTVIRPGDLADTFLDRTLHPEWNGEKTKLVYQFPTNEDLWKQYAQIRADGMREHEDRGQAGTDFYAANRAAMDEGAVVAWPEKFEEGEISGLQHAMNLRLRDEAVFFAEYQNEPLPVDAIEGQLTILEVQTKLSRFDQRLVPAECTILTTFIDVQKRLLYWVTCAWAQDFTGYVIDYGTWPKQPTTYFLYRDAPRTLDDEFPRANEEGRIHAGLTALTAELLDREWTRDDGAMLKIERCLIDANWGDSTDTVYGFCRTSPHRTILLPSHGEGVTASSTPYANRKIKTGEKAGLDWRIPTLSGKRTILHVTFDANSWKSFVRKRLRTAVGDRGCLSLYGVDPNRHLLLAEHVTAEYSTETEGRGRKVDEWKKRPARDDNHWLDGLVGCAMAASMQGAALPTSDSSPARGPRRSISELQRQARERKGR